VEAAAARADALMRANAALHARARALGRAAAAAAAQLCLLAPPPPPRGGGGAVAAGHPPPAAAVERALRPPAGGDGFELCGAAGRARSAPEDVVRTVGEWLGEIVAVHVVSAGARGATRRQRIWHAAAGGAPLALMGKP
jgi:hypothetical protein